jgi:hypothetical protein
MRLPLFLCMLALLPAGFAQSAAPAQVRKLRVDIRSSEMLLDPPR